MASVPVVLRQIRRARRRVEPPESRFERFRDEYEQTLIAAHELAGEEALDDVAAWAVVWTTREGHLPDPARFRRETRRVLIERGVEIPADSALSD